MLEVQNQGKMLSWWVYVHKNPRATRCVRVIIRLLLNTYRLGKECVRCVIQLE